MRDFFKDLFIRYKTRSLILFLVCGSVLFTTAWSIQLGHFVIQPVLYALGVFALFLTLAFFAYEKRMHNGDIQLEYDDDVKLPEVGSRIIYKGDEFRVTRVDKFNREVFAILV